MVIRSGRLYAAAISLAVIVGCGPIEQRHAGRHVERPRKERSVPASSAQIPPRQPDAHGATYSETESATAERVDAPGESSRAEDRRRREMEPTGATTPRYATDGEGAKPVVSGSTPRSGSMAKDSTETHRTGDAKTPLAGYQKRTSQTGSPSDTPVAPRSGDAMLERARAQQSKTDRTAEEGRAQDSSRAATKKEPTRIGDAHATNAEGERGAASAGQVKDSAAAGQPTPPNPPVCPACGKPSCPGSCKDGKGQSASSGSPSGEAGNTQSTGTEPRSLNDANPAQVGSAKEKAGTPADSERAPGQTSATPGGLMAGKGTVPPAGGSAPGDAASSGPEIHVRATRGTGETAATPIRGKVITPEYVDPKTPTGMQMLNLCEEYNEGSPDDLYFEQMPPARRELIRQYFENLRLQLDGRATLPAAQFPSTQPSTNPEGAARDSGTSVDTAE